jgi:AraC-like DNA-binding protein
MSGTAIATAGRLLWRMLERQGINPAPVFNKAGLDPESLDNPLARYPEKQSTIAWTLASELVSDPAFGLSIAKVWQPSDFHALGCAFMASATLREALSRLVRYHALVYNVVSYSLAEHDDRAILSYNLVHDKRNEPAILEDTRWAVVLDACRRVYTADLDPLEVTFWHSEPKSVIDEFNAYFRCPLRFAEPVARMVFPAVVLDRPLPAANRALALTLDRSLAEYLAKLGGEDMISRTKAEISDCLSSGNASIQMVATALHMSPRNLQRKLSGEGVNFRELVETVRLDLAKSYLADGSFTLAEIGYLIGFSSQAAFSRAFKRWTGSTPQDFRDAA